MATLVRTDQIQNPYKFRVYLNSAQNTGATVATRVNFDTRVFDTGSNVDITTNKGRFTAPVAGFYQFQGTVNVSNTSNYSNVQLFKNGVSLTGGSQYSASVSSSSTVADLVQLAAGDYVELFVVSSAVSPITTGSVFTNFSGYLVSAT